MPRKTRWEDVRRTAAVLFAENGYAGASLSQLARRSRVSKPGIYYHVRDKEELLFRICESTMSALLSAARGAVAAGSDPVSRLRGVIRAHGMHYWAHCPEHVILFGQMRYLSPAGRRIIVALEREYLDLVRGIIRDGQRRTLFRRVDPTLAAFALFAMLNTLEAWYDPRGRLSHEAVVAEIETLYLAGLATESPRRRRITRGSRL
jgi:AcrR family transcriptional regulator